MSFITKLYDLIIEQRGKDPKLSYTAKLTKKGREKIAQKLGEEAVELVIEAIKDDRKAALSESADLLYHLNVLWADMGITPDDVAKALKKREKKSGLEEKRSRRDG